MYAFNFPPLLLFIILVLYISMLWPVGWGELGYHNPEAGDDIRTPVIDQLIKNEALELDRFYGK